MTDEGSTDAADVPIGTTLQMKTPAMSMSSFHCGYGERLCFFCKCVANAEEVALQLRGAARSLGSLGGREEEDEDDDGEDGDSDADAEDMEDEVAHLGIG